MPFPKSIRLNTKPWLVVVTAASTLLAGVQMLLVAGPETKAPSPGMATATPASLSPIPVPDSLAQPRSLKQFGVPLLQTLAEIPTDNPQTPEKIALGAKLFFEPRC
jgi:cytochrome c peroxidase